MNGRSKSPSPCITCTRVANPLDCENKQCKLWQKWFLARWALIHAYPRKAMDKDDRKPAGVSVGGVYQERTRAVVRAYRRHGRK